MRIAVISDLTYRACLPWVKDCLSWYGSEPYHALLAWALQEHQKQDIHFFAPAGSSRIGTFHPLIYEFGSASTQDSVDHVSVNPYTLEQLKSEVDFVIDMSAHALTVENLYYYHGFRNFLVYRNGYNSFHAPRVAIEDRNYVVPSKNNQRLFWQRGSFRAAVAYYGIPDFYCPGSENEYFRRFHEDYKLETMDYFLFPHRPTPDKGVDILIHLAKKYPKEKFVISSLALITEHQSHLSRVSYEAKRLGLTNLIVADVPQNPKHHYFKRELMRRAKAILSPVGNGYIEGFGLANAEAVACGTPLIISDSESTRELWTENDSLIVEGLSGFENAVRTLGHYTFNPKNRYTTQDYAARYMELIDAVKTGRFLKDHTIQPPIPAS